MSDLNKFGNEINDFRNGNLQYTYSFNSVGNLLFKNESSMFNEQYLKLDLTDYTLNENKISEFYDIEFKEFKTEPTIPQILDDNIKLQIQQLESEVSELQNKVNTFTDIEDQNYDIQNKLNSYKDAIIELRIKNGEGRSPDDFISDFPFTPKVF